MAVAEVVQVEVAAAIAREQQRALRVRPLAFGRVERDRLQLPARLSLGALQQTLRERTVDVGDACLPVDVAPFEPDECTSAPTDAPERHIRKHELLGGLIHEYEAAA